jgi:DNA-binding transcriptional LysR family regulator
MFDWDDIRVFLATARAGTVRGAARRLGVTHATVSRRLHGLEDKLGAQLFERSAEGRVLSPVGHGIMPVAEQIEDRMAEIDRRAFAQDTRMAGPVRLSVSESFFQSILHPCLTAFQTRYPMIEIELTSTDRLSNPGKREADIVVRITNTPPESAYGRRIAASPLACYGSKSYLENRPRLDRWVALTHKAAFEPIVPARRVATANSGMAAARLIGNGHGIGLLPCYVGDADPDLHRVPDTALIPDLDIWILVHADIRSTPRVRALLDYIYASVEDSRDVIEGKRAGRRAN